MAGHSHLRLPADEPADFGARTARLATLATAAAVGGLALAVVLGIVHGNGFRRFYFAYLTAGKKDAAQQLLEDASKHFSTERLNTPVIDYLLGKVSADKTLSQNKESSPLQAHLWIGMQQLAQGQREAALDNFRWVKEHGEKYAEEYVLATERLKKLETGKK